jgi:hypothetical protein
MSLGSNKPRISCRGVKIRASTRGYLSGVADRITQYPVQGVSHRCRALLSHLTQMDPDLINAGKETVTTLV